MTKLEADSVVVRLLLVRLNAFEIISHFLFCTSGDHGGGQRTCGRSGSDEDVFGSHVRYFPMNLVQNMPLVKSCIWFAV